VPWGCKPGINKIKVITAFENESNLYPFKFIKLLPKINKIFPKKGRFDSEIEISGINFGEENENSLVLFNQVEAGILSWDVENIVVEVPEMVVGKNGRVVSVKVKTTYGSSNVKKFKVLPTQGK